MLCAIWPYVYVGRSRFIFVRREAGGFSGSARGSSEMVTHAMRRTV